MAFDAKQLAVDASKIDSLERALDWLQKWGQELYDKDWSYFELTFSPRVWTGENGSKEAADMISKMARFRIEAIIKDSILNCENTIEILREKIAKQCRDEK